MSETFYRKHLTLIALGALAALCVLFWADCLFGPYAPLAAGFQAEMEPWLSEADLPGTDRQWSPLLWDGVAQFYPWRLLQARAIRDGELALWNPHQMCGHPFVGNGQSALFYPPNWLLALVDVRWGMGFLAVLHYALAAAFSYLLGRMLRLRHLPAVFGAIGFSFGGFIVTWTQLPTLMNSIVWLPAGMLGVVLIFERRRWGMPLLAIALAMSLLAGHAQIAVYVWLVTLVYAGLRVLWEAVNYRRTHFLRLAGGFALALLLAAPGALPMLELVRNSPRGHAAAPTETGWEFHQARALQPAQLILLLDPDAFGNPAHGDHVLTAQGIPYSEHCGFVGITTIALALLGLGFVRTRHYAFFAFLTFAALNIAMAGGMAEALYWHVPMLGQAGSFSRFLSVLTFALPMTAAFGLDAVCDRVSGMEGLRRRLTLPSGVDAGTVLGALAVLLVAIELLPWAHDFLPRTRREDVYPVTPAIEQLMSAEDRVLAVTPRDRWGMHQVPQAVLPPNAATVYGYESVGGYDSLMPIGYRAFIEQAELGPAAPAVNGNMILAERAVGLRQALMGLSTVLADQRLDADGTGQRLKRVSGHGRVALYEITPIMPRAFLTPRGAVEAYLSDDRDRVDLAANLHPAAWRRIGLGVMEIALSAESEGNSNLLTVRETFYPGWSAYIDGDEREVEPVAEALCGVGVSNGDRQVYLAFEPATVHVGCFLALVGIGLLASMLTVIRCVGRDSSA